MKTQSSFTMLLILFCSITLRISGQVHIDTVFQRTVGTGVEQLKLVAPSIPWEIHLLKINIKNPYLKLESVLANEKRISSRELTSKMAARKNTSGHWVVGAINADFFNPDGSPVNMQVCKGELVQANNSYPAVGWTDEKKVVFGNPVFSGKVLSKAGTATVNKINIARTVDDIVLYNRFMGSATATDTAGTEYIIRPVTQWTTNDTTWCIIDSVRTKLANGPIPAGKAVLSVGSNKTAALASLKKGDTLRCLFNSLTGLPKITELLGGRPILIKNGVPTNIDSSSFNITRHPRTAIGFNADTSVVYFMEIDGRQLISKGIDLFELTSLMQRLGITNGMNFDGGGSSTMVVRGAIVNSPSDATGERSVANALLLVSTAPGGPVEHLEITPKKSKVYSGTKLQISVSALDSSYNPVTSTGGFIYTIRNPRIGTVNNSGLFTAGAVADSGYIIVESNGKKDSAYVIVTVLGSIQVRPKTCVSDNQLVTAFSVRGFDTDSVEVTVNNNLIQWSCLDTAYGKIDIAGQFQGKKAGIARIRALYGGKADTATVTVQIGYGTVVADSLESVSGWTVGGQNVDSSLISITTNSQFATAGTQSMQANYAFTYVANQYNYLYLQCNKPIYGVPDSIEFDMRSDGPAHRVFYDFTDALNQNVRVMTNKLMNNSNGFETIRGLLPKLTSVIYPLTLKSITVALGSTQNAGQVYQGAFFVDNMRLKYPSENPNGVETGKMEKLEHFRLYPNYPNPCNPATKISFHLPEAANVELIVYSALGQEAIRQNFAYQSPGLQEVLLQTSKLASGAYFCSIQVKGERSNYRAVNKLLVLK